jgi:hypothetical protein
MPRKPADIAHINLRIRENLRRKLEREAEKHRASLNAEIAARLQQTFEQQQLLTSDQLVENVGRALLPLLEGAHELNKQGDLVRAAEALIKRLQPLLAVRVIAGPEGEAVRQAIEKTQVAIKVIEDEVGKRLRKMHTTGADQ